MHTMHYPDEIRGTKELELPEEQTAITEAEMGMATMLIGQHTAPYDPSQFQDEYRLTLERAIEAKLGNQELVAPAPAAADGNRSVSDDNGVKVNSDTMINMTFSPPVALLGLLAKNPLVVAVSEEPPPEPGVPDSRRLRVILATA